MEEIPIEIDLGDRKESWTREQRWGVGKYCDRHACLWLGSFSRSKAVRDEARATYLEARL